MTLRAVEPSRIRAVAGTLAPRVAVVTAAGAGEPVALEP